MSELHLSPEIEQKYEVVAKMGEGGMGAVYKVRHVFLDELRVIKMIRAQFREDPDLQARFLREAQVATRLRHPGIAQLYDFSVAEDGTAYMVMELVEGMNVAQLLATDKQLALEQVVEIGRQGLAALAFLHEQKILHRDIASDNLMLSWVADGSPRVKLIDLGLAKSLEGAQFQTQTGLVVGKARYVSPEHLESSKGEVTVDARSDLYSFGIVLYELLTREYPIQGDDEVSIIAGHLFHPPKAFDETTLGEAVPESLRRVVMKALEKRPDDRWSSAGEFSEALVGSLSGSGDSGADDFTGLPPAVQPIRPLRTRPAPTAAGTTPSDWNPSAPTLAEGGGALLAAEAQPPASMPSRPRRTAPLVGLGVLLLLALVAWQMGWLGGGGRSLETVPAVAASSAAGAHELDDPSLYAGINFGASYALLIGNDEYQKLPRLETAVNDASELAEVLETRYGYNVRTLRNATRYEIVTALTEIIGEVGPNDNLLLFYAGHGSLLQKGSGYWLPIDAEPEDTSNWVSVKFDVTTLIGDIAARHVLVVADSCYSGALGDEAEPLASADPPVDADRVRQLVERRSRLALTSGGLSPVLDAGGDGRNSVFSRALLDALRGNQRILPVSALFRQIEQPVVDAARRFELDQRPLLAPIRLTDDEGGELFFVPSAR